MYKKTFKRKATTITTQLPEHTKSDLPDQFKQIVSLWREEVVQNVICIQKVLCTHKSNMTSLIQIKLLGTVTREQGEKGWKTNNKVNDSVYEFCL